MLLLSQNHCTCVKGTVLQYSLLYWQTKLESFFLGLFKHKSSVLILLQQNIENWTILCGCEKTKVRENWSKTSIHPISNQGQLSGALWGICHASLDMLMYTPQCLMIPNVLLPCYTAQPLVSEGGKFECECRRCGMCSCVLHVEVWTPGYKSVFCTVLKQYMRTLEIPLTPKACVGGGGGLDGSSSP